jgi:hypothetical protein
MTGFSPTTSATTASPYLSNSVSPADSFDSSYQTVVEQYSRRNTQEQVDWQSVLNIPQ